MPTEVQAPSHLLMHLKMLSSKYQFSDKKQPTGTVIGIDLQLVNPLDSATILSEHDFTKPETQEKILHLLNGKKADVVLSDMAPNATGVKSLDHELIINLCFAALKFSRDNLKEDGTFLCKFLQGGRWKYLESAMKQMFREVRLVKPLASRTDSAEAFALGRHFVPHR